MRLINTEKPKVTTENNEDVLFLEVDEAVIEGVRKGDITRIAMDINDDNYASILENVNGHLILCTEELPVTYHGCYFYNGGEFPYMLKEQLSVLLLSGGKDRCLAQIVGWEATAGTRFRFQGSGKPSMEDADGDSCIWEVSFDVVPIHDDLRIFLMRWNPSISSFSEEGYEHCVEHMHNGTFRMNWSIHEWEEARRGDLFYMLRVGDDKAGIAFNGTFISDPYVGDDWAGSSKRRLYVDMVCRNPAAPGAVPRLTLERLMKDIPSYNWSNGHSGELLPSNVAQALLELWDKA